MYLNFIRRDYQWGNLPSKSANLFSWFGTSICKAIFVNTTYFYSNSALPFDTLFIHRLGRRVRARRSIKSHSPSRFPRGGEGGKREQLPVFSGRLDLMIFSSVTREIPRGDGHCRRLYGMRSAKRAKRSYESRRRPFFGESFIPRVNEKYISSLLTIKFPSILQHYPRYRIWFSFLSLNKRKFNCVKKT